ncbi:MAG: PPOX class F420-dependent oxidoreductase, partial [Phycicoccus sp.]
GEWYTHVSVRGRIVRWEEDAEKALADIDRLSRHYGGGAYGTRDRLRISCWVEVERWHGWGDAKSE